MKEEVGEVVNYRDFVRELFYSVVTKINHIDFPIFKTVNSSSVLHG